MAASVVADRRADFFGHCVDRGHQLFNGRIADLAPFDGGVQLVNIRLVMLRVVNLHRLRVDVRFEGIVAIRQRR
jgi:hypothetical protein